MIKVSTQMKFSLCLFALPSLLSACCSAKSVQTNQLDSVDQKNENALSSKNDFVLTGKQKGAGKSIQDLLKTCPSHQLNDLMNDQFRLVFKIDVEGDASVESCLVGLKKDFEIQKNRIHRLDPIVKPKSRIR